jgi:hypothetical protein
MSKEQKGAAPAAPTYPRRVQATHDGFYKGQRVRRDVRFTCDTEEQFSARWMRPIDPSEPDELAARTVPKKRVTAPAPKVVRPDRERGTRVAPAPTAGDAAASVVAGAAASRASSRTNDQSVI